jgi:hypothetical protein
MAKQSQPQLKASIYPLMSPKERLAIWEKARGIWKHRSPDPARELKKMRQEWTRKSFRPDWIEESGRRFRWLNNLKLAGF